jgi:hypothetical protein
MTEETEQKAPAAGLTFPQIAASALAAATAAIPVGGARH